MLARAIAVISGAIAVVRGARFQDRLEEARWRLPADPRDTPTVALALSLDAGVWTDDRDFFGCGLPVWSTRVLRRYLAESGPAGTQP